VLPWIDQAGHRARAAEKDGHDLHDPAADGIRECARAFREEDSALFGHGSTDDQQSAIGQLMRWVREHGVFLAPTTEGGAGGPLCRQEALLTSKDAELNAADRNDLARIDLVIAPAYVRVINDATIDCVTLTMNASGISE
jgi:hypothetical protein